jgi:hypothetical protein
VRAVDSPRHYHNALVLLDEGKASAGVARRRRVLRSRAGVHFQRARLSATPTGSGFRLCSGRSIRTATRAIHKGRRAAAVRWLTVAKIRKQRLEGYLHETKNLSDGNMCRPTELCVVRPKLKHINLCRRHDFGGTTKKYASSIPV